MLSLRSYPTLKWFNEKKPSEYNGARKASGLISFVRTKTGDAVIFGDTTGSLYRDRGQEYGPIITDLVAFSLTLGDGLFSPTVTGDEPVIDDNMPDDTSPLPNSQDAVTELFGQYYPPPV